MNLIYYIFYGAARLTYILSNTSSLNIKRMNINYFTFITISLKSRLSNFLSMIKTFTSRNHKTSISTFFKSATHKIISCTRNKFSLFKLINSSSTISSTTTYNYYPNIIIRANSFNSSTDTSLSSIILVI